MGNPIQLVGPGGRAPQVIAVIDDESDILDLYEMMLGSFGEVMTFTSPEMFIQKMKSDVNFRPDLIITDYSMPTMNGVKMIQAIHNPENPIATILLSGYLDKEKSISAVNAGVTKILEKPVIKENLILLSKELLLEARNKKVQAEIAEVMGKLKEMFLWFRMLCMNELDLKVMNQPRVMDPNAAPGADEQLRTLENDLEKLEEQLQSLFKDKMEVTDQLERVHLRLVG